MAEETLLIYDGQCGFCRWGMHLVRRLDQRGVLRFCPFGHPVAESFLADLSPEDRYASYHAVKDGALCSAVEAARVTLDALPLGRFAVALGVHRLYPLVASNRTLLGRLVPHRPTIDTCPPIPTQSSATGAVRG